MWPAPQFGSRQLIFLNGPNSTSTWSINARVARAAWESRRGCQPLRCAAPSRHVINFAFPSPRPCSLSDSVEQTIQLLLEVSVGFLNQIVDGEAETIVKLSPD